MCPGRPEQPTTVTPESTRTVVEANVIGVIRVTSTMLPLLHRSAHPRVVNQSKARLWDAYNVSGNTGDLGCFR